MKTLKVISITLLLNLSFNANAIVVNTLNGITYEWYEVNNTVNLSRDTVESMLLDPNSDIYGYQYASRSLIEDLFLSYASWDGLDGYYGDQNVVSGVSSLITDFGFTSMDAGNGINSTFTTVDGVTVNWDSSQYLWGYFGESNECGGASSSCVGGSILYSDASGNPTTALQSSLYGWNSNPMFSLTHENVSTNEVFGSFLVREVDDFVSPSPVPVPAAAWLFGSALLGFVGFNRRNKKRA